MVFVTLGSVTTALEALHMGKKPRPVQTDRKDGAGAMAGAAGAGPAR